MAKMLFWKIKLVYLTLLINKNQRTFQKQLWSKQKNATRKPMNVPDG